MDCGFNRNVTSTVLTEKQKKKEENRKQKISDSLNASNIAQEEMQARVEKHYIKNNMSFFFRDYSETNNADRVAKKITTIDNIKQKLDEDIKGYAISKLALEAPKPNNLYEKILSKQNGSISVTRFMTYSDLSSKCRITIGDLSCLLCGTKYEFQSVLTRMQDLLKNNQQQELEALFLDINNRASVNSIESSLRAGFPFTPLPDLTGQYRRYQDGLENLSTLVYCRINNIPLDPGQTLYCLHAKITIHSNYITVEINNQSVTYDKSTFSTVQTTVEVPVQAIAQVQQPDALPPQVAIAQVQQLDALPPQVAIAPLNDAPHADIIEDKTVTLEIVINKYREELANALATTVNINTMTLYMNLLDELKEFTKDEGQDDISKQFYLDMQCLGGKLQNTYPQEQE